LNGNGHNWGQIIALGQLLNPEIKLVFLQGGAGTGKTLLSLASAVHQKEFYRQILVTRPLVHLEDENNMGFLPGDIKKKMAPWLQPIYQNLKLLDRNENEGNEQGSAFSNTKKSRKNDNSNNGKKTTDKMLEEEKIAILPLDYIRGQTLIKCFVIIDEAQNLTPHQVKTIITRVGDKTKIVFTGDLDQIDRTRKVGLDRKSSGLAYAISQLTNKSSLIAATTFEQSVRSDLAKIAEEFL
jgi:PhoH-like ATPase